jgi:hypothetical protein
MAVMASIRARVGSMWRPSAILAATVAAVATQVFFTSFLVSIIGLRRRRDET